MPSRRVTPPPSSSDTPIIAVSSAMEPFQDPGFFGDSPGDFTSSGGDKPPKKQAEDYTSDECHAPYSGGPVDTAEERLCELTDYRKTTSRELSGGNRRKLSVAMSLVAGPKVVFLDEPSAGMDPVARRGLWTTIQRAAKRCCVVLTTHHLEEVEALADIVAIMVDGSLQCIGDKVHLKNKYGSGYEVSMRVALPENGDALEEFMAASFPGAILNERDDRRFVFQLPREHTFGDVFEVLQGATSKLSITDYSVSQTSIEQIFLQMSERGKASS